jgi:Tol biopolymer transport system component
LSRQGRRLAYVRYWRDLNIWRVQIPGGIPAPFISSTHSEENPKFSPDGRRIAFRSDRSGNNEIWVCDSDGSNAVQLTAFAGPVTADLNWSPDGRRLAFKSSAHGHGDIYVIDAEGGTPRRLTTEPSDDLMPSWSRDGQWIYFASNRSGTDQIWKMPAAGGAAVQVTRQGGFYSQESPDGRFLYYGKGRDPTTSLWRMPVAGGEETRVLESVTWWMNFQVVDQGIYFIPAGKPPTIQFLRFTTGRIEPVTTIAKAPAAGLTVSLDGRTILFTVWEQGGQDLMLVENFR